VIAHNLGRKGKRLWTANNQGDPIVVYEASDERAEASFISDQILSAHRKGIAMKDHAILYRTNAQSNALEYDLKRNGIPYRVIGGTRFFDRAEIKDMLAYLCVLNNRNDDLRLERIINNPPRGLGAKAVETVERLAAAEGTSMYSVVSNPRLYASLEKPAARLLQFHQMIEGLEQLLVDDMPLPEFYDELMLRTGYAQMLQDKPTEENKTRLENIKELKSSILSYVQNAIDPSLAGFLEEIALYTDLEEYNASDDAVVMMTMHSAKGLEFPYVYLVGFEDGLFPGMRAIGDHSELEEERRLCYVAITRAKQTLYLTKAQTRMLFGQTSYPAMSRFVKEIPPELIMEFSVKKKKPVQAYNLDSYMGKSANARSVIEKFENATKATLFDAFDVRKSSEPVSLDYGVGDIVVHKKFGKGKVLTITPLGNDNKVSIEFENGEIKNLMAMFANLKKA
jgi:DNA helicase-2/ATP-dependent DNA helicase PcrA